MATGDLTETATVSAFDELYAAGVPTALRVPAAPVTRDGPFAAVGVASQTGVALGGTVIGPERSRADAWVIVAGGVIDDIVSQRPAGMPTIATGGVILPGLIDLHGHPEFNVFAPWEPPKTFINRGQWRNDPIYTTLIRDPWDQLTGNGVSTSVKKAMTRYAEVRAAVAGVTAIQGASKDYPNKAEALVRNVDLLIFGTQVARSTIDFDRLRPDDIARLAADIGDGTVKAHYVHLAEGQKSNAASVNEFRRFSDSGLFGAATVVIHGTALTRTEFDAIADAGAKLVWSPQSNLRLYDETTDIKAALDAGVPVAIGADWMPSGSPSLLHELKVARRCLAEQGCHVTPRQLVMMVTRNAAEIAGLGDKLGRLETGRPADLLVLARHHSDPYESVLSAYPSSVELVMVGGDIVFGRSDWIDRLIDVDDTDAAEPADPYERVIAWGRPMALDTRFGSPEQSPANGPPRRLSEIRSTLIARHPGIGPVFT